MKYFAFAISDSMFHSDSEYAIYRKSISAKQVKSEIDSGDYIPILNPSHTETIKVMENKYQIHHIHIPEHAPKVILEYGDTLICMCVRDRPRMENRHEYTKEEIEKALFSFSLYQIFSPASIYKMYRK